MRLSGFGVPKTPCNPRPLFIDPFATVTFWKSFEDHEKSHADEVFSKTFVALTTMCSETKELGYDMLWQGEAKTP